MEVGALIWPLRVIPIPISAPCHLIRVSHFRGHVVLFHSTAFLSALGRVLAAQGVHIEFKSCF